MRKLEMEFHCEQDVELFDTVFDSFHQHEVSFTHACIRALNGYIDSEDGPHKEQLTSLMLNFDKKNMAIECEEPIVREIIIDAETYQWLDSLVEQFNTATDGDPVSHPEALVYGMAMVSFMQMVLSEDPKAALAIDARRVPFSHMIALQPQLLN